MGHAVYTLSDPREVILKRFAQALAEEKGMTEEFELYNRVEGLAGKLIMEHRKLFKNVCANVDFYSGFVYSMLGIPEELFTPIFAIARMPGWSAHRSGRADQAQTRSSVRLTNMSDTMQISCHLTKDKYSALYQCLKHVYIINRSSKERLTLYKQAA